MLKYIPVVQLIAVFLFVSSLLTPYFPTTDIFPLEYQSREALVFPDYYSPAITDGYYLQGYNQCAGYATAFVQRYYNQLALGSENYEEMSYPLPFDIGVPPHRVINHLRANDLTATARTGDIDTLKYYLSQGRPIIVMVGDGLKWQHYMVAVGYNNINDEIYFYDPETGPSLPLRQKPGNLTLSTDRFLSIWENNLPFFSQMFITVEPQQRESEV